MLKHCLRCLRSIDSQLNTGIFRVTSMGISSTVSKYQGPQSVTETYSGDDFAEPKRSLPIMTSRPLEFPPIHKPPKQAWLETLESIEDEKLGIVDLHPDIFATFPRLDMLWYNVYWQSRYRKIDYRFVRTRAEMKGGGRKPWPQKGTGRARHGSIRSPLWKGGGKCFGPRGPKPFFFMLSKSQRTLGLRTALTVKFAQDNLHIVDSLDLPSDDPEYLQELVESRGWGLSVLFVDDTDMVPQNIALATDEIKPYNIMPVYGLNVYSMLKHETLVLTIAALEKIEHKLLEQMHSLDCKEKPFHKLTALSGNIPEHLKKY